MGDHAPRDIGPHEIVPRQINESFKCRACGGAIDMVIEDCPDDPGGESMSFCSRWVHVERASKEERDKHWHPSPKSFRQQMREVARTARDAVASAMAGEKVADP